ncbi:hypothetical protein RRG08_019253 [Elysia crispata]|uniref:Uncharacterized protein n=1 Tax=Elysia crispata TaxID=231223 RepID=A0AAE1E0B0_9GAST|nr:hypothetical protein RRG08_019253 [Elysia crispata]
MQECGKKKNKALVSSKKSFLYRAPQEIDKEDVVRHEEEKREAVMDLASICSPQVGVKRSETFDFFLRHLLQTPGGSEKIRNFRFLPRSAISSKPQAGVKR